MPEYKQVPRYLNFEQFVLKMKKAPAWTLEKKQDGLTLTVTEDERERKYVSPNPAHASDLDWALFSQRIGNIIDTFGMMIKP